MESIVWLLAIVVGLVVAGLFLRYVLPVVIYAIFFIVAVVVVVVIPVLGVLLGISMKSLGGGIVILISLIWGFLFIGALTQGAGAEISKNLKDLKEKFRKGS